MIKQLLHTKRLPVLSVAGGFAQKLKDIAITITLLLIWSNGYELIRGHLVEVLRKGGRP